MNKNNDIKEYLKEIEIRINEQFNGVKTEHRM